jgi:hypothetical protein
VTVTLGDVPNGKQQGKQHTWRVQGWLSFPVFPTPKQVFHLELDFFTDLGARGKLQFRVTREGEEMWESVPVAMEVEQKDEPQRIPASYDLHEVVFPDATVYAIEGFLDDRRLCTFPLRVDKGPTGARSKER